MENKEKKEPIEEMPVEEITEEKPDEPFIDRPRREQMSIKDLWVGTIKDIITKAVQKLLTQAQYDDLTDGGATTLHKHDHGGLDGLNDNDHGAIYYTEAEVDALVAGVLSNVVEDTSPQLGGDLDVNNHNIDFPSVQNISDVKDEDDMASNHNKSLCTQQSIKAYVDTYGCKYTAEDALLSSADTARQKSDDETYTKIKEIRIDRNGTLRIKFDLGASSGGFGYGTIYKNGGAVGTERVSGSAFPGYTTYSEDLSGWAAGDLVQLYYHSDAGRDAHVRNFRIYVDEAIVVVQD